MVLERMMHPHEGAAVVGIIIPADHIGIVAMNLRKAPVMLGEEVPVHERDRLKVGCLQHPPASSR